MSYLKMFLMAHVYFYGQNRLPMNLYALNNICDAEFANCVQKATEKQDLLSCLTSPQKIVRLPGAILTLSTHKFP